ncbi:LOW QUALITY PROTEIN: bactericidal permeability-increasing protein-like [Liolophura sinensis]|uniref:LOW QUALITY PROTEIN: bactericidal permeability-increasing protein-like n=1 Tax=Liolophura sinensis TaxID=3198878 RepID=UPI0031589FF0
MRRVCCVFFLYALSVVIPDCEGSLSPGFHSRVTSKGLNYAAQVAVDVLSTTITKQKIPDVDGSGHNLKYSLSNIKITGFDKPQSSVVPRSGSGLTWSAKGLGLSMRTDFSYKYKTFISISGHGSVDVSIRDTTFSLSVGMGEDSGGRPSIKSTGCKCDIGHLSIKFHGGASWLYNLLTGLFKGDITRQVQKIICSSAQGAVDKNAESSLSKLPVTVTIDHKFMLDYRLLTAPVFSSVAMDIMHKGEVYWSDAVQEAPFPAPPIPPITNVSRMIYFLGSEYLVNTMAYVANKHGILKTNVTDKDLPADKRGFLNTTCQGFTLCLGKLVPKVAELYPNSKGELNVVSTRAPQMSISPQAIAVSFGGNISFFARTASTDRFFLFSIVADLNATLTACVKDEMVFGKIKKMQLGVKMWDSRIGPVDAKRLQLLLNGAISFYVKPQLNKLAKGFPLPVTSRIKFVNAQLSLAQNALILGTDLTYSPKEEAPLGHNDFRVITGRETFKNHQL